MNDVDDDVAIDNNSANSRTRLACGCLGVDPEKIVSRGGSDYELRIKNTVKQCLLSTCYLITIFGTLQYYSMLFIFYIHHILAAYN